MTKSILSLLLFLNVHSVHAQETSRKLVINELMQSNIDCVMDDLKEFPDSWVELYNNSQEVIQLKNYRLGISTKADEAYQLPSGNIQPHKYLLVYCDRENKNLHTHFRLESGKGCKVYLFKDGEIVDSLPETLMKMPAPDIAYGRKNDGGNEWGYQLTPTPGKANNGGICSGDHILGEPVFSEKGLVRAGSLNLKLTLSLPEGSPEGTVICYTTNGEEPTASSTVYTTPLNIRQTTVVRARLFCDGWLSPRSTVESYISHGRDVTLPVISIAINKDYLDDDNIGIYANNDGNKKRKDWRRPMNIEFFFTPDAASDLNQLCETRITGGASRGANLKSMGIYAHKRFGTKRFEYEFFPDQKPGLTDFKSLMLRNAGNDFDYLYMRDAIIQRTMASHVDVDWQAWRPAIVYINGVYRGMLNIRERSNEDNIYTNYDGLEDIDMIENWNELKEGDKTNFNAFKEFYNEHNHTMAEYEQWMDCTEFINLMIPNLFYVNLDFPGNNIMMWRPRTQDGRWRWIMKDTDFGLGLYDRDVNYNTIEWLHNQQYDPNNNWANGSSHTRLFRRLMEDEDFNREFIDRCYIYMGDFMNLRGTREVWDPMYEMIKYEYPYHRKLFNQWWPNYNTELSNAHTWLQKRTEIFSRQLADFYELGTPINMTVNTNVKDAATGDFSFNGIRLSKGTFDGKYLTGRKITLESGQESLLNVTAWRVITDGKLVDYPGSKLELTTPQCKSLIIYALVDDASGIHEIQRDVEGIDAIYDLNGHRIDAMRKGVNIIHGRNGQVRKVVVK